MGGRRWLYAVLVPAVMLSVGCMEPSDEAKARLAETKASGDALVEKFEGLEERFLVNQANVKLYDELRRRHGKVSEIACANQGNHYNAMVKHIDKMVEKARKLRRRTVASASDITLSSVSKKSQTAHD